MVGIKLQDHHPHDHLDAGAAALQHARQPAGLALEMKAQRQLVHVDEGDVGELAHRMHRDAGENAVAPLRQHRHQHAHCAVADGHQQAAMRSATASSSTASTGAVADAVERIDRPFEGERHRSASRASRSAAAPPTTPRASSGQRGRPARYRATGAPASRSGSPFRKNCWPEARRRQRAGANQDQPLASRPEQDGAPVAFREFLAICICPSYRAFNSPVQP